MNKTLILKSFHEGIAVLLRTTYARPDRADDVAQLATFTHGNLQRAMMFAAIRTQASLSMGVDIEIALTVEDAQRLVKFYDVLAQPVGIEVMIRLACEQRIEQGDDATAVAMIEG